MNQLWPTRSFIIVLLMVIVSVTLVLPIEAATLTVCASGCDYTTIADAIAAASAGDTISVLDAVHTEANIIVDRNLIIRGQGTANTTAQAASTPETGIGPVFVVNSGVVATIQEMTISNGSSYSPPYGGGVLNQGSLTISNSTLAGNSSRYGGGVHNYGGTLTVSKSTFVGNSGREGGGGVYNNGGTLTIDNSTLAGNSTSGNPTDDFDGGGGVFNVGTGSLLNTISNSTLTGNSANHGGGIFHYSGTLTINNSTLSDNSAEHNGGGVLEYFRSDALAISNGTLSGNSSAYGGGIFNGAYYGTYYGMLTVSNSTLFGNSAGFDGGGICNYATLNIKSAIVAELPFWR